MSYPANIDLSRFMHIEGRLCVDPTDLSEAFPHGGTALGICQEKALRWGPITRRVRDEASGQVLDDHYVGQTVYLGCYLRGYDLDTLKLLHPNYRDVDGTERIVLEGPAYSQLGGAIPKKKLLFSPFDAANHPGFIFYAAGLRMEESAELAAAVDSEMETAFVVQAYKPASGLKAYEFGLLGDLNLNPA